MNEVVKRALRAERTKLVSKIEGAGFENALTEVATVIKSQPNAAVGVVRNILTDTIAIAKEIGRIDQMLEDNHAQ